MDSTQHLENRMADLSQGGRLKAVREKLGFKTLEAFGTELGNRLNADKKPFDKGTLSKYESGTLPIAAKVLVELNSTYKVNLDWLRTGNGSMFLEGEAVDYPEYEQFQGFFSETEAKYVKARKANTITLLDKVAIEYSIRLISTPQILIGNKLTPTVQTSPDDRAKVAYTEASALIREREHWVRV